MWGAEDLIAALDTVYLDIADTPGRQRESTDAVHVGFTAKVCIHPSQIPTVRAGQARKIMAR